MIAPTGLLIEGISRDHGGLSDRDGVMFSSSRSSAALVAIAVSASLLAGCGAPADDDPTAPEEAGEGETPTPSNEPSAENPHDADDVDVSSDVALRAVSTALSEDGGKAVSFQKETEDEAGMEVQLLIDGEQLQTVVVDHEGASQVDSRDAGEADEWMQEAAPEAEVPMLRAMQIAQTESTGVILAAQLEDREGDLIVWTVTIEGAASENTVIVDARNGAIVPEGDNPVEDNNIGGDPDTLDEDAG